MKRIAFLLSFILLISLISWFLWSYQKGNIDIGALLGQLPINERREKEGVRSSGVVQVQQVSLSLPTGGRVAEVLVEEGDRVSKGQKLLRLDRGLFDGQVAVAEAQVQVALAALQHGQAGVRPGKIAIAEAQFAQAKAIHEARQQTVEDVLLLRDNQQELDLQIAVAEAQIVATQHRLAQAVALKDAAEENKALYEYLSGVAASWRYPAPPPDIPTSLQTSPYEWWKAWINVNAIKQELEGERAQLAHLRETRRNPLALEAQINEAYGGVLKAAAAMQAAQAELDGYRAGVSPEELDVLEAQLGQARAALGALLAQEKNMELAAPIDGNVLTKAIRQGEIVGPGVTALILGDLSIVTITAYIAEPELGRVRLGQKVEVSVDAWPGRLFSGVVSHISETAEYTPRNAATQEGRMLTYYGVEITLDNRDGALKPGMPADVLFVG